MKSETDIYADPAYFRCETLRCRMKKAYCVNNQDLAAKVGTLHNRNNRLMSERGISCKDCEQGRKIKKDLQKATRGKIANKQMEDSMGKKKVLKHPCRECKENEAIVSKTTGNPTHGLCRECFATKLRAAARNRAKNGTKRKLSAKKANSHVIRVDFGKYVEVLEAMKENAKIDVRTLEQQIIWECMSGVGMVARREEDKQWLRKDRHMAPKRQRSGSASGKRA